MPIALSLAALDSLPQTVTRPAYRRADLKPGIVHFGLGNFHRAHAAVNTALAMAAEPGDWGIVGIANRSRKVTSALEAQDGLYSVVTLDPAAEQVDVIDVHRRFLVAAEDYGIVGRQVYFTQLGLYIGGNGAFVTVEGIGRQQNHACTVFASYLVGAGIFGYCGNVFE